MKTTKKTLSVLLAVIMIMSSMSVCFGTFGFTAVAAEKPTNAQLNNAFAAITDTNTLKGGDGTLVDAADLLYNWVAATASTNSGSVTGSYKENNDTFKVSPAENNSTVNLNAGADAIVGSKYAALIDALIPAGGVVDDAGANNKKTGTKTVSYDVSSGKNFTVDVSADLNKVLLRYYSISEIPSSILMSASYTYTHNYKQEKSSYDKKSGCNTTTYWKSLSWHYLNKIPERTNVTYNTTARADFEAAMAVFTDELLNKTAADMILVDKMDAAGINALVASCTDAIDELIEYNDAVKARFLPMAKINAFMDECDFAKKVLNLMPAIDGLKAAIDAGYDKENLTQMQEIYAAQKINYDTYAAASEDVVNYVTEHFEGYGDLTVEATRAFLATLALDIEIYQLKEHKVGFDAHIAEYGAYDEAGVDEGTVTSAKITAGIAAITADQEILSQFSAAAIEKVCSGYSAKFTDIKNALTVLGAVAGYNERFIAEYEKFTNEVKAKFDPSASSEELMQAEQEYLTWYNGLNALIDEMRDELGYELAEDLFDDLNSLMVQYMESAYTILNNRMTAEIDEAYELYESIGGEEISMVNLSSYAAVKDAVGDINTDVYNYLKDSAYNKLSAETVRKYNELKDIILAYQEFKRSIGFDTFKQTTIDDIVRPADDSDVAREGDYTVTDENVEKVVKLLDSLLQNDEIKALIGQLLVKEGEEPEPFDLANLINGLLEGIYTDDIINAIVQYVYPLVAKEFAKVWAGLPKEITIPDVETGQAIAPTADVNAELSIDAVEVATANFGVATYPIQLGELIAKEYPQYANVAEKLKKVTTKAVATLDATGEIATYDDPWADSALFIDEEGNQAKTIQLAWGVTDKASFIDAAVAALSGLENLLLALVSNINYNNNETNKESDSYRGNKVGTGSGSATIWGFIPLGMTIDPISLVFMCSANDGYDNVLAPLFELLGVPNNEIPHGETLTSTRKILEDGLFNMLDKVIGMLSANPVDTILNLLPNLAYAVEAGMIQEILGMLKTDITYEADANYNVTIAGAGKMEGALKSEKPIKINIGEMLNLEDLGLDLSSFNAVWKLISGAIGMELPAPNGGMIATMGSLATKPTNRSEYIYSYSACPAGEAVYIDVNQADLLIYIVRYVLGSGILDSLISDDVTNIVKDIISNILANPDMTVAAVVELLNQVEYDTLEAYEWYDGEVGGTVEGITPAMNVYLNENDWTKETADYVSENIDAIVNGILKTANLDVDLSAKISGAIDSLFTQENMIKLKQVLASFFGGEEVAKICMTVAPLLYELTGVDLVTFISMVSASAIDELDGIDNYTREDFVREFLALFAPLNGLFEYILGGENLVISADGETEIELIGYNGYDNAIVPLLEALGCDTSITGETSLEKIVKELLDRIAEIEADPINEIIDLLPGVLYYLASDGLETGVRNLLQPIYVILDTIKPIYALDLNELLTGVNLGGLTINFENLGLEFVFELLDTLLLKGELDLSDLKTLIYDVCKVIGVDYAEETNSAFLKETGAKKGSYGENFDRADMITVILSFAIDFLKTGDNAKKLDDMIGTDGIINGLLSVFNGTDVKTEKIKWMYYFPADHDFTGYSFETGVSITPTIEYLNYPTNWTEETAKYISDNLPELEKTIVQLIDKNQTNVASLLAGLLVKDGKHLIYNADNVIAIRDLVADLLKDIDSRLLEAAGILLDADVAAFTAYEVGAVENGADFAEELAGLLETIPGLVNWLLFGADYDFLYSADGKDAININGAEGYAKGLAPVLEALGVELPEGNDVEAILKATFARLDAILADPVIEVFEILPNVIYFINADGISASVQNLLSAVYALLDSLKDLGVNLDINKLIGDAIGLNLTKLDIRSLLGLAENALKLDLEPAAKVLYGLCVGTIKAYKSVSGEYAYKMIYDSEFARYDMITILATTVLEIIKVEANKEPLSDLLGEDIYNVILGFFDMYEVPMKDIAYTNTDKADTNYVFSALKNSEIYKDYGYGQFYTEEKAQYVADNIGDFINNVIYLVGIEIEGENVNNLSELLNGLVNGNLYNSKNVEAIRDALKGVVDSLEGLGNGAGKHIVAVLKTSLGVDLSKYDTMTFEAFDNDRAKFEAAVCQVLEPLFPLLKWLLADEDFTFFADEKNEVMITLKGAEGYAYGVVPLLETLFCENVMTTEAYYSAVKADEKVLITSILTVLLDRVDVILANPAEEILSMLPNIIYFINSNGVDTVVKNTLNAVYTVLNAIEPIAKVDLYEIIGFDLSTITFEWIFEKLIALIAESTGYEFAELEANAVAELTVGKLVSYKSANGKKAYKMIYQSEKAEAEMVTVVERLLVTFIMHENNREVLINLLKDNFGMSADAEKYVRGVLDAIADNAVNTPEGMDRALGIIYYVYYGVDLGIGEATGGLKDLNKEWQEILKELGKSDDPNEATVGNMIASILDIVLEDIFTSEGVAPNGFIAFFKKIVEWFQAISDFFKNLFN